MPMPVEQCGWCGLWIIDDVELEKHVKEKHEGRFELRCEYCPAWTPTHGELVDHLNKKHHGQMRRTPAAAS